MIERLHKGADGAANTHKHWTGTIQPPALVALATPPTGLGSL